MKRKNAIQDWNQPELEEQAKILAEMFYGNAHFNNVRGQLKGDFMEIAFKPLYAVSGELKSRTQGKKDTQDFFNSFMWVQEKIGQLERQGMFLAAEEVRRALINPDYVMLGLNDALQDLTPVTLVMFEASLTLAFLSKPLQDDECFLVSDIPRSVRRSFLERWHYVDSEMSRVYSKYIFTKLQTLYRETYWKRFDEKAHELWQRQRRYYTTYKLLPVPKDKDERKKQSKWLGGGGFAEIFQASKEDIVGLLTPEEQKRTAFWEFQLPKGWVRGLPSFGVGLHLAEEHPYWQKIRTPFCSSNISFGRGAVFNPGEAYNCFDKQSEKFTGTRMI